MWSISYPIRKVPSFTDELTKLYIEDLMMSKNLRDISSKSVKTIQHNDNSVYVCTVYSSCKQLPRLPDSGIITYTIFQF